MSFEFDHATECLKLFVQRKLVTEQKQKQHFALLLCGGRSANDSDQPDYVSRYNNIHLARKMSPLDWDLLEMLNSEAKLRTQPWDGDEVGNGKLVVNSFFFIPTVLEAVCAGVDCLKEAQQSLPSTSSSSSSKRTKVRECHLLIVSNLCSQADVSLVQETVDQVKSLSDSVGDVNLVLIGCQLPGSDRVDEDSGLDQGHEGRQADGNNDDDEDDNVASNRKLRPAFDAVARVWTQLDAESYTFNDAIPALTLFESRAIGQRPWKVNLRIGGASSTALSIPLNGFTQVKEAKPPSLASVYAPDPSVPIKPVTKFYRKDSPDSEVDVSEVIKGYRYGQTLVPFTNDDRAAAKLPSSEKSLDIISFTDAANVPRHLYTGDNVLVFVPDDNVATSKEDEPSPPSANAMASLAQAMFELNCVVLVRRVYNSIANPRLGVLTPEIRGSGVSLVYTDLAFADDYRSVVFPSLPLNGNDKDGDESAKNGDQPDRQQQLDAMNAFVDSMLLTGSGDDEGDNEAGGEESDNLNLLPERIPNPWIQRLYACLSQRGLDPLLPLPSAESSSSHDQSPLASLPGLEAIAQHLASNPDIQTGREALKTSMPRLQANIDPGSGSRRRKRGDGDHLDQVFASSQSTGDLPWFHANDPCLEFNTLVQQGRLSSASSRMESSIIRLVTDPFTVSLTRPQAVNCLARFRSTAIEQGQSGQGDPDLILSQYYNAMLTSWRQDLVDRRLLVDLASSTSSQPNNSTPSDPRLSFWLETIVNGYGLVTDDEVAGIGVTRKAAEAFLNPQQEPPGKVRKIEDSLDDLIDAMDD